MQEDILIKVGADISDLAREMRKAKQEVSDFGTRMSNFGKNLQDIAGGVALSFGTMTAGIALPLKQAVQTSVDFDTAMRRAATIAGATSEEFDALKQTALDLGAATTKSAQEVAVAMSEMAAKGYDVNQIIAAMPGVIAAAEASGEDLALTADTVSSALNAFGLEASEATRVADVLAQTANQSAAGIQDMQHSFKYAAPVVSSLGVSLEELAAATGIMADVGIRGEQAGTTLRGGLVQLLKPTEKTAKMMESMGIQVTDANGKFIGLSGVIREFQESMKGMTDTQKLATLSQIVGTEAASGFLALMKAGPSEIEKMTKALENSGGASKEAAEQMMGGIGGALEELSGAFETLSILIGSQLAPYIQAFATWLSGLIQRFNEASPAVQKFVVIGLALTAGLTGLIAVLGAVAAGIGFMITGIMPLISAIAQAGGVTALLSGALAFLANPITLTIAGITALVAAFAFAYSQFEGFRNVINSVFSTLLTFVQPALTAVTAFIREQISALSEWWRQIWPDLSLAFMNIWNGIVAFITPILNTILALFKFVWPAIEYIIKSVWENIKGVIEGAIAVIAGIIQAFSALFIGNWGALWNAIKQIISGAIQFVWNLFNLLLYGRLLKAGTALLNGLKAVFSAGWNAIKTNTSNVFTSIWNFLKNIWNGTVNFFKNTLNGIRATFMNVFNAVRSFVSNVFSNIRTIISNAINTIKDFVSSGLDNIRKFFVDTFDKVVSFLKGIDLVSVGKDIISGLVRGLSSMAGAVIDAVADIAGKIKDKFLSFFDIHSPSRVMRDEVGKYLPLGLIAGIQRMKNDVISAAEQMAQWATPDVPDVAIAYSTPSGLRSSLSSAVSGTVDVNTRDDKLAAAINRLEQSLDGMTIVMDGERVGQLVRPHVNEGNAVDALVRRYFD